jgi:hypothetical protein
MVLQLYALRDFFKSGTRKSTWTYQLLYMHVICIPRSVSFTLPLTHGYSLFSLSFFLSFFSLMSVCVPVVLFLCVCLYVYDFVRYLSGCFPYLQ